jgi:hypothetical protein
MGASVVIASELCERGNLLLPHHITHSSSYREYESLPVNLYLVPLPLSVIITIERKPVGLSGLSCSQIECGGFTRVTQPIY